MQYRVLKEAALERTYYWPQYKKNDLDGWNHFYEKSWVGQVYVCRTSYKEAEEYIDSQITKYPIVEKKVI
jgi:hypothetical protein